MGCRFFLQGIFLTQGLNPYLRHRQRLLHCCATRKAQEDTWKFSNHENVCWAGSLTPLSASLAYSLRKGSPCPPRFFEPVWARPHGCRPRPLHPPAGLHFPTACLFHQSEASVEAGCSGEAGRASRGSRLQSAEVGKARTRGGNALSNVGETQE